MFRKLERENFFKQGVYSGSGNCHLESTPMTPLVFMASNIVLRSFIQKVYDTLDLI